MCVLRRFSLVQLFATPWTVVHQAPLLVGLSQQEYWRELPCPPPGELPDAEIELTSTVAPALAGKFFTTEPPWKPISTQCILMNGNNYGGSDRKKDECKKGKVVKNLKLLTSIKLININI